MPQPPSTEDEIWGIESDPYPGSGSISSETNEALVEHFPELRNEQGAVDPTVALLALIDRIKELEDRINGSDK